MKTPEKSMIEKCLASESPYARIALLERFGSTLTPEQAVALLHDPHIYVRKAAIIYLRLSQEQMGEMQSDQSWHVRKTPPRYLKQSSEQVERSLRDVHPAVRAFAVLKQELTAAQIRTARGDKDKRVREAAEWKELPEEEKFSSGMSSKNWFIRVSTIEMFKQRLTSKHVSDQLKCSNWYVRKTIASVDHVFDQEQVALAMKDPHWRVREAAGWHQDLSPTQTDGILDDESPAIRALAYAKRKLDPAQVSKGLADPDPFVREAALIFQSQ